MKNEPMKHLRFDLLRSPLEEQPFKYEVAKIAAQVADLTDRAITEAITEAAIKEGLTDLYLIDKRFIFEAITEKLEREDPKPLTLEELRQMDGEPVFVKDLGISDEKWCVVFVSRHGDISAHVPGVDEPYFGSYYRKDWLAYRYKPKGEANGTPKN